MVHLHAVVSALLVASTVASGNLIVRFKDQVNLKDAGIQNALNAGHNGLSRRENIQQTLQEHATVSFDAFMAESSTARMNIPVTKRFWIENAFVVDGSVCGESCRDWLESRDAIADVREARSFALPEVTREDVAPASDPSSQNAQSNVAELNVEAAWAAGLTGAGVIVGTIDSGVRFSHDALRESYRGYNGTGYDHDYSFYYPTGLPIQPDNADIHGHGTHTMGTFVGAGGMGVAYEAEWIHARGCNLGVCPEDDMLSSAEWVMCPTRRDGSGMDCSRGAQVLSNSWGGYERYFIPSTEVWKEAGIFAVFAAGNASPLQCGQVMLPGSLDGVFSVGATQTPLLGGQPSLWQQSAKGPSPETGAIKPDFVGAGTNVRSAASWDDGQSMSLSGTSMSTPLIAGAVALMVQATNDNTNFDEVLKSLQDTTSFNLGPAGNGPSECDGIYMTTKPSNHYGFGIPDVCAAANQIAPGSC
jgi:subtilisin family serine protease